MKLCVRLGDFCGKAWLWPTIGLLLVLGSLCSTGIAGAGDLDQAPAPPGPAALRPAPLRPAAPYQLPPGTGFAPPSMDLSHLTGEQILQNRSAQALPASFDWRDQGKITKVRDQGKCGSCYTFSYLGSFESRLLIDGAGTFDLSENNAKECNWRAATNFEDPPGVGWGGCDKGNALMMTTLLTQKGTVQDSCDPYQPIDMACKSSCPYQHTVLDWREISGRWVPSPEVLKQYVYDHGPIVTSMFSDHQQFKGYDGSHTLNYSAPGDNTDHSVLIVGWSDQLPALPGETAPATGWIVKNSWGTGWGDEGYFYIAYGAANIGTHASFPHEWQAHDPNGDVWFYDEDGWGGGWGCGITTAWGLAKFIADEDTNITRVEFWTTDITTDVDVYLYDDFDGLTTSNPLASKLDSAYSEAGYHSVLLDTPVPITRGDDVAAVVKFSNVSYVFPVPYDSNGPIESGRTYLSCDGEKWYEMGDWKGVDMAIRLRTRRSASPAPIVTGITPNSGTGDGAVSITDLAGSHFQPGATVKLTRSGQAAIHATGVTVVSDSKITCQFDLAGRAHGAWDVVVTNPDTQSGSLLGGFTVKPAPAQDHQAFLPLIASD